MQAQIKVQNPGKMFVWLFFLFYFKYTGYGKRQSFIYRGHSLRFCFYSPFHIKMRDLSNGVVINYIYSGKCLIRTLVTFSQHSNKTL